MKSRNTPIAAWIQNDCKAGIFVNAPTKNARVSQTAAVVMLGPTDSKVFPILIETVSPFYFLNPWDIINILSTPIAKIKNGIT